MRHSTLYKNMADNLSICYLIHILLSHGSEYVWLYGVLVYVHNMNR
nr:MAG TPA: hypothetical protein [Caudoviricetes sp.]DAT99528.1 MAG TPA: hypothetical protein [Caudoviricetes sp.]